MKFLDDLIDGDGAETKAALAEEIDAIANPVVAEAWSGQVQVPCPHQIVGRLIGPGGAGINAIAAEAGLTISYEQASAHSHDIIPL